MKAKYFLFLLFGLLILASCEKPECKEDDDCLKPHFTGACLDGKCVYAPVAGECGNGLCEEGETKCTCPSDCGPCVGFSDSFQLMCINDQCVEAIPASSIKPQVSSSELSAGGDKIRVTSNFNQPFNMKRDLFHVDISLSSAYAKNSDRKIKKLVLVGQTSDRQTIPLADLDLNRPLWPGSEIAADLIVDFPTAEKTGKMTNLELQITYDYITGTTAKTPKSIVAKSRYSRIEFDWVNPSTPYPCPESCDDDNPGTEDVCDASTNFFCEHRPIPGMCGNYICDSNENPCTCPEDCGPCEGNAGTYLTYVCAQNACVAQLNPGITKEPKSLFDDRKISQFHLQNNYGYPDPLDITVDKIALAFDLYDKQSGVSDVTITNVRVFESTNEIASATPNLALPDVGSTGIVELTLPVQAFPEESKSLTLKVWYEFKQDGETKKGSYSKPLGKITILSPGLPK